MRQTSNASPSDHESYRPCSDRLLVILVTVHIDYAELMMCGDMEARP